ncbi:F-box only protein 22 [Nothobranchius furzeri]|uniref:F-box protein 22 n=1 Tax=Nothobranchius furzeri TaxID=105023 RepID=A0A1A7ZRJ0_NOTFU|nr:F-box only protein 22 [Nothobranchius furzeri]KAF7212242.1 F-box protein 22 [Nothobranchius furzeri]
MSEIQELGDFSQDSKAAYVLSNVAEVVERILTFVPTKSLLRIESVCRLWRNCARRVLRTQQQLAWASARGPSTTDVHTLCNVLAEEVEKVFLLPKTVLMMADSESFNGLAYSYSQSKAKKIRRSADSAEELNKLFPKCCDVIGITSPGIVLTPTGSWSSPPQEYQEGEESGFAVMFPSIEGVHIKPFHFCKKTISSTAMKEAGLVDNPELRVVLMFVYGGHRSGGAQFINQFLEPLFKSKVLIAGGLVETVFSPPRRCCSQGGYGVMGLALSGPKVQGASVLLDHDVSSPKAAEATVRRLKAAKIPERNTLGFMFACVGRGPNYYNKQSNVEADAFHKVFPNTPLFGLFGNGEIGCDRIVKDDYTLCDSDPDCLQHEYTTVMSLVHFG